MLYFQSFIGHIKTSEKLTNMVIGTLTVDRWAVTFGTARRGLGGLRPYDKTDAVNFIDDDDDDDDAVM